jgi:hypothetical protein
MLMVVRRPARSRRLLLAASVIVIVVLIAVASAVTVARIRHRTVASGCVAVAGAQSYRLDLEQAANATTIAAIGKRLGMPDHAVTVALAAAIQESRLHNLAYGDLDSLGLFQQRPSEGWGTPAQIMTPSFAAAAFYQHLVLVDGWATLSVTDAAQQVQHSAAPSAYAQWEPQARTLAQVLTGEVPAGLTCQFPVPAAGPTPSLEAAVTQELGPPNLGTALAPARGWTVAAWLVGHAQEYRLRSVAFAGRRWTSQAGAWSSDPSAGATVEIVSAATTGPSS